MSLIDTFAGVVLKNRSGMAARCSNDLMVRRKIDGVVHQVRKEIAEHCIRITDERDEPPLLQQR
jgi:hypothetical protein